VARDGLQRNVRLYPWYVVATNAYFWLPVFFLYFNERVSLEDVLRLEAIYYAAVVLMEVPSGYMSDRLGRRVTLLVSTVAMTAAHGLFWVGADFLMLAAAQTCLAAGIAFNSGTDTALHYDSLAALKREKEYAGREAMVARNAFFAGAVAAVAGGAVAVFDLRFAYGLSFVAAVVAIAIVVAMVEPGPRSGAGAHGWFVAHLGRCAKLLGRPSLRWLFCFAVLMTILNHIPYEFYQPYIGLLAADLDPSGRGTPLAAGLHAGVTMLIGAWIAGRAVRIRDRIGLAQTLLLSTVLQVAIIAAMALVLHPLIALLIVLRSSPRALMAAPLNAAVVPQVGTEHRATYLSMQSLAGRLAFAGTLAGLSSIGRADTVDWPTLATMLRWSAAVGLVGLVLLAVTARQVSHTEPADEPATGDTPPTP